MLIIITDYYIFNMWHIFWPLCQICEIFIEWDGLWCPCCGYRLRSKPRNLRYKAKLRQRTAVMQEAIDTIR
jgi:predicted amidophosphoribosyltransferase